MKHIVNGFTPFGGKHCITTALRQHFCYAEIDLSEEMLFGLGGGFRFCI